MARSDSKQTVFSRITSQDQVRSYLERAAQENKLSHSYLFLGAPGSGKREAARALACACVCDKGGCGACDECIRVLHRTHPDVSYLEPEGIGSYLVEQIKELLEDVYLAPVRAKRKVYIIDRVDLMGAAPANALLKTIEEPPQDVVFILLGRSREAILPTIVSRCQCVPFKVLSSQQAQAELLSTCGVEGDEARIALSVTSSPEQARQFLASAQRREVRRLVLDTFAGLEFSDSWDLIKAAGQIVDAAKLSSPAKAKKASAKSASQAESHLEERDYLSASAIKKLEDARKRELTSRERSGMMEALAAAESLLRDVLMYKEDATYQLINTDYAAVVHRIAQTASVSGIVQALQACRSAQDSLSRSVSPQLVFEAMLLCVKEALQ